MDDWYASIGRTEWVFKKIVACEIEGENFVDKLINQVLIVDDENQVEEGKCCFFDKVESVIFFLGESLNESSSSIDGK